MKNGIHSTAPVAKVCAASKPAFWARFLFKLIREIQPSSCVELGSCVGISAAYQAAALAMNKKGRLRTLEGSPAIADIARQTLEELAFENTTVVTGPFHKTLQCVLEEAKPVDFFFNDGHHDHNAVICYFDLSLPYLADNAMVVFDDICWSPGMKKAWSEIEGHERVVLSLNLGTIGFVVVTINPQIKQNFRFPL